MSTRNNQDRLGGVGVQDTDPIPQEVSDAGLSFATPTEFVDLPSLGRYYPENHPLHGQDTVEIRYMTAKDEDILTSQSLIKKGVVIDRLVQSVLIDKSVRPQELLIGDKNAILVAARVTGYGSDYETRVDCPACNANTEHVFDLNDSLKVNHADQEFGETVRVTDNGTVLVQLPLTNLNVEARLMTGKEETKILSMAERKKKLKLQESSLTDQFKTIIVSVDGHTDASTISSVVDRLPAHDARHLRDAYAKVTPNVELTSMFECDDCGHVEEVDVPITVQFFWPK
jgi:transcription elongation factor Elf1